MSHALTPIRLDELTSAQLTAAESQLASPPAETRIELLAIGSDGSARAAEVEMGETSDRRALVATAQLLMRRDTRAIRVLFDGLTVYELERPAAAPRVDALLLDPDDSTIAVRVRGQAAPVMLSFDEPDGEWSQIIVQLAPKDDPNDPCWLGARPLEEKFDGRSAIVLNVLDVFHHWQFSVRKPGE